MYNWVEKSAPDRASIEDDGVERITLVQSTQSWPSPVRQCVRYLNKCYTQPSDCLGGRGGQRNDNLYLLWAGTGAIFFMLPLLCISVIFQQKYFSKCQNKNILNRPKMMSIKCNIIADVRSCNKTNFTSELWKRIKYTRNINCKNSCR